MTRSAIGAVCFLLLSCGGGSGDANSPWVGEYTSPRGVSLTLEAGPDDTVTGELTREMNGAASSFAVELHAAGRGLEGTFASGDGSFPLSIANGEEPGQIVVTSEGAVYELSRVGGAVNPLVATEAPAANPLAQPSSDPSGGGVEEVAGANFHHPGGYFSMKVPSSWEANMMSGDVFELVTGVAGDLVIVLLGDLDQEEMGKSALELMPTAMAVIDGFLQQNAQIQSNSANATTQAARVGPHSGATSTRPATIGGNSTTIWQGLVVKDNVLLMLISSIPRGQENRLTPALESAFESVRLHRTWQPGELDQAQAQTQAPARSGRNVVINGKRIDDATLASLEGPSPVIPDGKYWYDKKSGMAGNWGGPTEAYLAAGLNLGGALAADASGGQQRQVAFNGRYLHPIDVAGLEYHFGPLPPGRYWLDGEGNYGLEGQPQGGNLVEEIAAMEMIAAEMQNQMQQQFQAQLQQQLQQYQGQGGYYGQGGQYYDQGYGGGGSVYRHFPNLGASGSGVTVADAGGGDTIVNAGGVLWWPGK